MLSQNLEKTLHRAMTFAADRGSELVTLEHLLFALVDDQDASEVLIACSIDIEKLKNDLLKTQIKNDKRFVILDDVDSFNSNSLNALLKIIEEPNNNYFILINNKSKPVLETIKSVIKARTIIPKITGTVTATNIFNAILSIDISLKISMPRKPAEL